jgi:asparagine synthase (glutamine-hydrolysing)
MLDAMGQGAAYQSGATEAADIGVYAGWVASPGSFAVLQNRTYAGGTIDLMFAGECFHDGTEMRSDDAAGHRDVARMLLRHDDLRAENVIRELNGLFSGVLIDRLRRRAMLFNDRYGLERVYVHEAEHGTYFASEAKALLRVLSQTRSFDYHGVAQHLAFGCAFDGTTLFRGIRILDGGSLWMFEPGRCRKTRYFTPAQWERQSPLSTEDFQCEFQFRFKRALPRYLRGERRIGLSLTGGLDSRMIVACLPAVTPPPICYTFGALEGETLDARIAGRVAAECGLEHRLVRIGRDFLADFDKYIERTVYVTDGCAGALAAHEIYLNAQAKQAAHIRLTGNFGSEVLRGMSTFKGLGMSRELVASEFRAHVDAAAERGPGQERSPVTFAAFREVPTKLFGIMASAKSEVTFRTPYLDNDLVSLAYRAPASVLRSSASAMRMVTDASPRLGRIPTDRGLVQDSWGFPHLMKMMAASVTFKLDYMHREAPPRWLMRTPGALSLLDKMRRLAPHRFLAYRQWFQNPLADYVAGALADAMSLRQPFWRPGVLRTMAADHVSGRTNYVREIDAVLTLAAVERLLLRSGDGDAYEPDLDGTPTVARTQTPTPAPQISRRSDQSAIVTAHTV